MQRTIEANFAILGVINEKLARDHYKGNPAIIIQPIEVLKYNTDLGRRMHMHIDRNFDRTDVTKLLGMSGIFELTDRETMSYRLNYRKLIGSDVHQILLSLAAWLHVNEPDRDIVNTAQLEDVFDYML